MAQAKTKTTKKATAKTAKDLRVQKSDADKVRGGMLGPSE